MAAKVGVLTDSSTCLPVDFAWERGIGMTSISTSIEGVSYVDGETDPEVLYDSLERGVRIGSSAVNVGDFETVIERLLTRCDQVLGVVLSGGLSATIRNLQMAAASFDEGRVMALDTDNAAMGEAAIVLEAARQARDGVDMPGLVDVVRRATEASRTFIVTPNLQGLIDIARLTGNPEMYDEYRGFYTVIRIGENRIVPVAKSTDPDEASRMAIDGLAESLASPGPYVLVGGHARAPQLARSLIDLAGSRLPVAESHLFASTATVTSVVGLGLWGVGVAPRL